MPRLLGDEMEDDQAKVAVGEEAAETGTAAAAMMTMASAAADVVAIAFSVGEAPRRGDLMGMWVRHQVLRVSFDIA